MSTVSHAAPICRVCLQNLSSHLSQSLKNNQICSDKCLNVYLCTVYIKPEYTDITFKAEKIDESKKPISYIDKFKIKFKDK